jgi:hypothetical protein
MTLATQLFRKNGLAFATTENDGGSAPGLHRIRSGVMDAPPQLMDKALHGSLSFHEPLTVLRQQVAK